MPPALLSSPLRGHTAAAALPSSFSANELSLSAGSAGRYEEGPEARLERARLGLADLDYEAAAAELDAALAQLEQVDLSAHAAAEGVRISNDGGVAELLRQSLRCRVECLRGMGQPEVTP